MLLINSIQYQFSLFLQYSTKSQQNHLKTLYIIRFRPYTTVQKPSESTLDQHWATVKTKNLDGFPAS